MNGKELFGVVVRTTGLGCIGYGLCYVMSLLYMMVQSQMTQGWSGFDFFLGGLMFLAVGFFLLRRADCVVGFAYPKSGNGKDEPDKKDEKNT